MLRLLILLLYWPTSVWAELVSTPPARAIEPLSTGSIAQVVVMLLLVVILIFVAAWLVRRMGNVGIGNRGVIKFLGSLAVGQRERVVLIQVGDTQLLLGVAQGQVNTLYKLEQPIETDSHNSNKFAVRLQEMLQQKKSSS